MLPMYLWLWAYSLKCDWPMRGHPLLTTDPCSPSRYRLPLASRLAVGTSCPLPAPCSRVAWLALAPPQASCHNDSEVMRAAAPLCLERILHHCHPPTSGSYNISASLQNNSWVLVGDWLWISVLMAIYCRKNPLWWEMYYPGVKRCH